MFLPVFIALVVGYLLGSLPFGYLVARARGVNIFEVGSKNPGATNVRRVLGSGAGNLVLILDALKGAAAVGWPLYLRWAAQEEIRAFGGVVRTDQEFLIQVVYPVAAVTGLLAALLGHSFSCFTRFRGGKGVATGAGGFVVLFPLGAVLAIVVWLVTLAITRYASLASMLAAASLPFAAFSFHRGPLMIAVSAVVALFVIVRHRANIVRLRSGTEIKVGQNKTPATS